MYSIAVLFSVLAAVPAQAAERHPAVQALVAHSTDIIVAEVLSTNPRKALEGARDTVQLKVRQRLKGRLSKGQKIGVYYHLLWVDTTTWKLEPKKFVKGKSYVVFLKATTVRDGDRTHVEYALSDRWFGVAPDHPQLVKTVSQIATAPDKGDSP